MRSIKIYHRHAPKTRPDLHVVTKETTNLINIYVGRRIKLRRKSLGFTLDDISIKTGISLQMCSKYERGAAQIPPYALLIISYALSISVDLLFPENPRSLLPLTSKPNIAGVIFLETTSLNYYETELLHRKETEALIAMFRQLPTQELRRSVRVMVRTIARELRVPVLSRT